MQTRNKPFYVVFASYLFCHGVAYAKNDPVEKKENSEAAQTHKSAQNEKQAISMELLLFIAELSDVDGELVSPLDVTSATKTQAKTKVNPKQMKQTKESKNDPHKVESHHYD